VYRPLPQFREARRKLEIKRVVTNTVEKCGGQEILELVYKVVGLRMGTCRGSVGVGGQRTRTPAGGVGEEAACMHRGEGQRDKAGARAMT
jgi:hypothetical protein